MLPKFQFLLEVEFKVWRSGHPWTITVVNDVDFQSELFEKWIMELTNMMITRELLLPKTKKAQLSNSVKRNMIYSVQKGTNFTEYSQLTSVKSKFLMISDN